MGVSRRRSLEDAVANRAVEFWLMMVSDEVLLDVFYPAQFEFGAIHVSNLVALIEGTRKSPTNRFAVGADFLTRMIMIRGGLRVVIVFTLIRIESLSLACPAAALRATQRLDISRLTPWGGILSP
jgi:hypothetical protein